MSAWTPDTWLHFWELVVMILGVALPLTWGITRMMSVMKDFPPHRHAGRKIFYPKGMEPPEIEDLKDSGTEDPKAKAPVA